MEKKDFDELSLYRQTIAQLPVHIYWKDAQFRYMACNNLQAFSVGLKEPSEIIGKTDFDLSPATFANMLRKNDIEVIKRAEPCLFEEEVIYGNQEPRVYLSQKIPLKNADGEIIGLAGMSIDITARKDAEQRIFADKEKAEFTLESILDNLPGHVYWKNREGVIQGCNERQAISAGYSDKKHLIGKTDFDLPWQDNAQELRDSDLEVMNKKITLTREEHSHIAGKKEVSIFLSKKAPLFNKQGEVIGILGISFDITDRKKLEEELIKAKEAAEAGIRARTEFIANMSHDIRTPLTGIIGISEFFKEDLERDEDKDRAETINLCGKQLLGLLNSVLEVSSLDSSEDAIIHQSFDLYQLIEDLCQLEKPAVEARRLALHASIDENIPRYLMSDKMKIHRILLNLIGNGIKFTEKGSISLDVKLLSKETDKVTIEFSVKDTGIGIPEAAQSQVFERFYKVTPSWKGKFTGNGIGLHIVQKFTSLLGGQIHFESREGEGTRFYFTLTLSVGEANTQDDADYNRLLEEEKVCLEPEKPSVAKKPENNANQPKALLVEDNAMALTTLKLLLSRFDLNVSEAMDAEIGLELIKKHHPFDLIITDIGLPGISGDKMVAIVRDFEQKNALQRQKIVALTGHAAEGDVSQKCKDAGIDEIYQKPMGAATIKELIEPLFLNMPVEKNPESQSQKFSPSGGKLGIDLPDTEAQLFAINHHPLFDIETGEKILGSRELVLEVIKDFKKSTLNEDLDAIKNAHTKGDWQTIEKLSHKLKGGACYGTVRLNYALLYMERYLKAGHTQAAEALYQQMIRVIDETAAYLEKLPA